MWNHPLIRKSFMRKILLVTGFLLSCLVAASAAAAPKPDMLFFYSKDCEHCAAIRKDVLPDFLQKYGSLIRLVELEVSEPAVFDSLLAMESRVQFPEDQKDYPAVYFMGTLIEGEIPVGTRLESLVKAWMANPDSLEALNRDVLSRKPELFVSHAVGDVKPVHLAYFFKQGCKQCSRAQEIILWLEKTYPNVKIDSFDIAAENSMRLATALGLRSGVPQSKLMSTPVFFAGKEYVLADSISQKRLADLVIGLSQTGAEAVWDSMSEEELAAAGDYIEGKFQSITLAAVALAALGDGINPCAFATILFFVSYLTMLKRKKNEIAAVGLAFAFAVFLTYFLVGLGFLNIVKSITNVELLSRIIFGGAAALCLVFGFLSIFDYFKARSGKVSEMSLQLPAFLKKRIHATIREQARTRRLVLGALTAGFTVSILEFACTGQVYLPTITYMASRKASAIGYLFLYNALFILPLLAVFGIVYFGVSSQTIARVMEQKVGAVKLVLATVFFVVGGLLFWSVFG
jgi:cytochrome c biogenesis protein CcdA